MFCSTCTLTHVVMQLLLFLFQYTAMCTLYRRHRQRLCNRSGGGGGMVNIAIKNILGCIVLVCMVIAWRSFDVVGAVSSTAVQGDSDELPPTDVGQYSTEHSQC